MNVIDKDGRTIKPLDPAYEFHIADLAMAVLIVVLCFGIAGYCSVIF